MSSPKEQIVIERSIWIAAPRERVWQAITDDQQIQKWWHDYWSIPVLEAGATIQFGTEDDPMTAKLAVIDPPREFVIEWPPQAQFHSIPILTRYLLIEENGGTRITVSETGLEALSDDIRQQKIDGTAKGYETVLSNLKNYLEGSKQPLIVERSIWIDAPIDRAWRAVTETQYLDQWYANRCTWEIPALKQGATVKFHHEDVTVEVLIATIDVMDAPREFTLRWQPDSTYPEMVQITRFLLVEENGGTRVTIHEAGYEGLPAEVRQQYMDQVGEGYSGSVENLKALLEGRSMPY